MPKKIDLKGKRFGMLVVIEEANPSILKSGKPRTQWKCICDCGKQTVVSTQCLIQGTTLSCGCYGAKQRAKACAKKPDKEVGKKYGSLTILKTFREDGRTKAECICECGTKHIACLYSIKNGDTSSCGCKKNNSKMEQIVNKVLNKSNFDFARQYTSSNCKYKQKLQFDFAIFDDQKKLLCLIECQGIQHFIKQPNGFGDQQREITDQIKKSFCNENNIKLYEILYNENAEERINEILSECKAILCQASK